MGNDVPSRSTLQGIKVMVIEGAGHFVRRDARDRFHTVADAFLDETVPAR